jgi:protoporphyrinogen oxidase
MKVGIVGGGLMGLALAQRLAVDGHRVQVFEHARQVGGLATWHDYGAFEWDRFYHVILPTDVHLIQFIKDIGLGDKLRWHETQTGFYVDNHFYSMNDTADFIRFPPLSMWSKFRLAMTILYGSRINNWRRLERTLVEDWLIRTSGRATYEKMWKPLLLAKLGENYKRVSAVFIWSYIKRLFSARDSSARKEHMGYVSGGYKTILTRLLEHVEKQGGEVRLNTAVEGIRADPSRGIWLQHSEQWEHFDKVVFTSPVNVLRQVAGPALVAMRGSGDDVEYLGVVCMVMITSQPVVPYYVLNIADSRIPFTGVVGMSSIVSTQETAGKYITYFPKYVLSTESILKAPNDELEESFMAGFRLLFPDFDETAIESVHINRAAKVQPLQVIDYSRKVPRCDTLHPDFFVLNTSQFVNSTLNNNEVIRRVNIFIEEHGAKFNPDEGVGTTISQLDSVSVT